MSFPHWLKWFGETLRRTRESTRKPQVQQRSLTAEVLEPRCLLIDLVPVADAYQSAFGQMLVADANPTSSVPPLTLVESITYSTPNHSLSV